MTELGQEAAANRKGPQGPSRAWKIINTSAGTPSWGVQ